MKWLLVLPLLVLTALTMSGCAKSPSGGAVNPAPDRLEVVLNLRQTLEPNYYYAVAFDDTPIQGVGPVAIVGNTEIFNGVVGGDFRLAVVYHLGQFTAYYRTDPDDLGTERIIANSFFVGVPQASPTQIRFTLDLNALAATGQPLFPNLSTIDRLDINFVTTNTIIRNAQDNRRKPLDSYGTQAEASPLEFQIGATRRFSQLEDNGVADPLPYDSSFSRPPDEVNFGRLDVSEIELNVTRD